MTTARLLLLFFDRDYLFKLILALLAWSLVPLGEIFLFIYLGGLIGNSLVLILAAVAGAAGVLVGALQARRAAAFLRAALARGSHPGRDAADVAGLFASALLLITPGFVTDAAGFLLLVPPLRAWLARRIAAVLKSRARDVYDRLRLSEMS
ncbi:MAG: FxsA family protein [Spirochaetia bacterium]